MKGVILAAGLGARLNPSTLVCSKILLPIYDKPMIYYPLSLLISAGIREVMIVCSERDYPLFDKLFKDSEKKFGVKICLKIQYEALGTVHALLLAEKFCDGDEVCLIFGDNFYFGEGLSKLLKLNKGVGVSLFGAKTTNPQAFGIAEVDEKGSLISIEEKPKFPKSDIAVTGLYLYESNVFKYAKKVKLSVRGEYEITDLNNFYINSKKAKLIKLPENNIWMDTGTHENLLHASSIVHEYQNKNKKIYGSPEAAAYEMGFLTEEELRNAAKLLIKSEYGKFLESLIK